MSVCVCICLHLAGLMYSCKERPPDASLALVYACICLHITLIQAHSGIASDLVCQHSVLGHLHMTVEGTTIPLLSSQADVAGCSGPSQHRS